MPPVYHLITPGDHYSPRTGSAIPSVVHGLVRGSSAAGDAQRFPQLVVLDDRTYRPRHDAGSLLEYEGLPAPSAPRRALDAVRGRLGGRRIGSQRYFAPACEAVRDQPPGIVLAHNAPAVGGLLRDSPHATVLYAHNDLFGSFTRSEAARALEPFEMLVCVSEFLADIHRAELPRRLHDRIAVVLNGVDCAQFHPAESWEPGPLRIFFVGRNIPRKGADILLDAVRLVADPGIEVHIVGSAQFNREQELSSYERRLRAAAHRVPGRVVFEPFVDRWRLPSLLRQADIMVVPSRWAEPAGLTVGEGLACGLPVIASRVGGIPEMLGDAGRLFDPHEPAGLAEAIAELAVDPGLRARMGRAARRRALAMDWPAVWGRLAGLLDRLAQRTQPAGRANRPLT